MTEREDGRTVVAWDAHCETWLPEKHIGESCPFIDSGCDHPHKLRKRLGFVCPAYDCGQLYFSGAAFIHHIGEHLDD